MDIDERYWIVYAHSDEDTSDNNRINEVSKASGFEVAGLVDERAGGVIGYVSTLVGQEIADCLNAWKALAYAEEEV